MNPCSVELRKLIRRCRQRKLLNPRPPRVGGGIAARHWASRSKKPLAISTTRPRSAICTTNRGERMQRARTLRGWNVFWLVDSQVARRQLFWTRDEALEAAGLRE
jgi:hypothetical protein